MNLTDSEIIKALEICLNETDICNGCPYEFDDCLNEDGTSRLMQAALDLIKRQKEENEDLERIVGLMNKRKYYRKFVGEVFRKQKGKELTDPDFDYIYQLYFEQQAEINKLNTAFDVCKKEYDDMFEIARKQKAEIERLTNAYKQCAWERDIFTEDMGRYDPYTDSFAKEMVGGIK